MDSEGQLGELLDLAERLGVEIRRAWLGGDGGGLCVIRGKKVLFLDTAASPPEQVGKTAAALAAVEGVEDCYVRPEVRELLDGD